MKLKQYANTIAALAKKHPDLEVAYACDDEGNKFDYVRYSPQAGTAMIDGEEVDVVIVN